MCEKLPISSTNDVCTVTRIRTPFPRLLTLLAPAIKMREENEVAVGDRRYAGKRYRSCLILLPHSHYLFISFQKRNRKTSHFDSSFCCSLHLCLTLLEKRRCLPSLMLVRVIVARVVPDCASSRAAALASP